MADGDHTRDADSQPAGGDGDDGEGPDVGAPGADGDLPGGDSVDGGDGDGPTGEPDLDEAVVERATELTRRAREAVDEGERDAYREDRAALLDEHDYVARVRDDDGVTLVLHPEEWLEDGLVRVDRVEDTDRAVERPLSGPGDGGEWDAVEAHNRAVADLVRDEHGPVHGATAHAFADFMSNHYARRVETVTPREREEFRTEYVRRNAWPSDEQLSRLERSLELVVEAAESS